MYSCFALFFPILLYSLLRNIRIFYVHADFLTISRVLVPIRLYTSKPLPIRIPNRETAQVLLVAATPNELTAAKRLLRANGSESAAEVAAGNAEAAPLVDGLDPPDTASVLGYKEAGTQSCWRWYRWRRCQHGLVPGCCPCT